MLPLRVGDKPNPPRKLVSWGVSGELLGHSTLLETAAGSQGQGGQWGEKASWAPAGSQTTCTLSLHILSAQAHHEVLESTGRSRFNTMRHSLFTLVVHPVRGGQRGDPAVLGEGQEAMPPPPPHTHTQGCSANVRSQEPKGRPGEAAAGEPLKAGPAASANIGETAHSRNRSSPALEHGSWVWGEASGTGTTLHFILKRSVEPLMSFQWGEPRWSLF